MRFFGGAGAAVSMRVAPLGCDEEDVCATLVLLVWSWSEVTALGPVGSVPSTSADMATS